MTMQYWIGEHNIDQTRNQISHRETTLTMAPKALSVLALLAKNQGSVVSHEEILDAVWKDAVVTPNTLQRSIAQLRKAFGDDAKQQKVIKTHAKQGYSLELEVNWHKDTKAEQANSFEDRQENTAHSPRSSNFSRRTRYMFGALAISLTLVIILLLKSPERASLFSITGIQAMTATDDSESGAIYSADGNYIIFTRSHNRLCGNRIWVKHIASQQEALLTPSWGNYGSASLSPDGTQLVFTDRPSCQPPLSLSPCYSLKKLDFQQALTKQTQASTLLACNAAPIKNPLWLSDNALAFMHKPDTHWQLLKLAIDDTSSQILYQPQDGSFHAYDVSLSSARLAIIKMNGTSQPTLDLLTLNGELISSHVISDHTENPMNKLISPKFVPKQNLLIFSTGRRLFSLTYDGQVARIMLPLDESMSTPRFNLNGTEALVTKGYFDSDIGTIMLPRTGEQLSPLVAKDGPTNIARTNSREQEANFHPDGHTIAFVSTRSGTEQLWLKQNDVLTQLTDLPLDSRIDGFQWSRDGNSVLININGQLVQVALNGAQHTILVPGPVTQLFYWDSDAHTAIVNTTVRGTDVLAELNLKTGGYLKRKDTSVHWADKSSAGRLVYLDHNLQFWQSRIAGDAVMAPLNTYGSRKRFVLEGEVIYGMNSENQLWTFDLERQTFTELGSLPQDIGHLTDIHNNTLLLSYFVTAKKEIVELKFAY